MSVLPLSTRTQNRQNPAFSVERWRLIERCVFAHASVKAPIAMQRITLKSRDKKKVSRMAEGV